MDNMRLYLKEAMEHKVFGIYKKQSFLRLQNRVLQTPKIPEFSSDGIGILMLKTRSIDVKPQKRFSKKKSQNLRYRV